MSEPKAATRDEYARRILRVLVHVQQNLDAALPLEELAAIACFSPFHFHRIFRGMVGESVAQYVRRLRLERAAMRLKHGKRPVTDIAFEAGYEAHEAFTRAFNAAFGCSPSAFRSAASSTAIASPSDVHFVAADADMAFHPLTMETESMDVSIKTIPPMRIAFVRHVGPYHEVGEAWERLCDWAGPKGLLGPNSQFFGACYDDPEVTDPAKIRYDACITVDESVTAEGDIGVQTLGGGRYATVLHEGPYEKFGETYAKIYGQWLPANGCEPADPPSLEFYLNDPNTTEPEDLQTEVCVPIED
jgi:AraC family transcriptional regulator